MFADADEKVSKRSSKSSSAAGTCKSVRRVRGLRSLTQQQVSLDSLSFCLKFVLYSFLFKCYYH